MRRTRARKRTGPIPTRRQACRACRPWSTILLDHVNKGSLTLERFVDLTASGPQRIFGIAGKGRIARGYDADFTIVDMGLSRTIENKWIASRCGWTPFDGMKTKGWPVATILRGNIVMRDFALTGRQAAVRLSKRPCRLTCANSLATVAWTYIYL